MSSEVSVIHAAFFPRNLLTLTCISNYSHSNYQHRKNSVMHGLLLLLILWSRQVVLVQYLKLGFITEACKATIQKATV